jgi:hypothetical protein
MTVIDATTPRTIEAPLVAAIPAIDDLPSSLISDRDTTVKEIQPTKPDLCNVFSSSLMWFLSSLTGWVL